MRQSRRFFDFLFGAAAAAGLILWGLGGAGMSRVSAQEGAPPAAAPEYLMQTQSLANGGALLFVLNTEAKVLSVYEAQGGLKATRGVTFVASRKIERDVYVSSYFDRSEYSYQELGKKIEIEESRDRPEGASSSGTDSSGAGSGPPNKN